MRISSFRTVALTLALTSALSLAFAPRVKAEACIDKAGSATGLTRGFAEYEAFLIIRQVTGNWPIQTDRISKPNYTCAQKNLFWHCRATARICKS